MDQSRSRQEAGRAIGSEYAEMAQRDLEWARGRAAVFQEKFQELLTIPEVEQPVVRSELWSIADTTLTRFSVGVDILAYTLGPEQRVPEALEHFVQGGQYQAMLIYTSLERAINGGSSMPEFYNQITDQTSIVEMLITALPEGYPLPDNFEEGIGPFLSSEYDQKLLALGVGVEEWARAREAIRFVRDEQVKLRLGLIHKE